MNTPLNHFIAGKQVKVNKSTLNNKGLSIVYQLFIGGNTYE